ncbi:MAG: N-acetylglucosamine-6-phosphate deacetylase [Armatimonadota bacterium]|nr:N-acetylglucosamine-6-phosphate deacetylase [Armatimonadota bacterium]MDR7534500.1 N-acetylglucosamine-6-phosphate deacetylase [Armatimonadota bacterium]MDR7537317.1 N-acetylglucosamine-6-phosphate deacetylase [Armatimonadota bacterium]
MTDPRQAADGGTPGGREPVGGRWVIQAGRLLRPGGLTGPGFLKIEGDRIAAVSEGYHPAPEFDAADDLVAPGFVDLQVNGAAGCDFLRPTPEGLEAASTHLLRTGTVAYLPTLISAPTDQLQRALAFFAPRMERPSVAPRIAGVHLEGPFLSRARPGAHRIEHLRPPSIEFIGRLLDEFQGVIRLVTLAPELDGALDLIDYLVGRGIVVALGHTEATYAQARAAFDRGARLATHLFNAMRPFHHREPGVVGAALSHPDVTCSIIADLVHLHPAVVAHVIGAKTPARTVLITDAVAAAGTPGGISTLGDREVRVRDGAPRLPDGTLAGSVLTMDAAVRHVGALGVDLLDALRMASVTPAELLGRPASIAPGAPADLVVLDARLVVRATIVAGRVVYRQAAA